jgi:lipoprotein-anchoring transpeptidase ErfK/SrfK
MKSLLSNGRTRLILNIGLLLVCGCLVLAVFWFMASPLGASFFAVPTPAQDYTWSYVEIAKPVKITAPILPPLGTATQAPSPIAADPATPVPANTLAPAPSATEPPGQMTMDILENTPVPVYVAPEQPANPAESSSYTSTSKYILVDISEQHMYVYDGGALIYSFVASTGLNNATRIGTFAVQSKIPNAYGATWNIWMPNWLGIYWAGSLENGIHALPILPNGATLWAGFLGRPVSYGCVVLGTYDSSLLYNWAEIGTTVEIQR